MKCHLACHGLTRQQYREKWGPPKDFPMVAPNYAAARSEMVNRIGLGHKGPCGTEGERRLVEAGTSMTRAIREGVPF